VSGIFPLSTRGESPILEEEEVRVAKTMRGNPTRKVVKSAEHLGEHARALIGQTPSQPQAVKTDMRAIVVVRL